MGKTAHGFYRKEDESVLSVEKDLPDNNDFYLYLHVRVDL